MVRGLKSAGLLCAALCACLTLLAGLAGGSGAAIRHTPLGYDPATQSHPGACSQDTLNIAQAVADLNANGVLGHYASIVGVHATGSALVTQMRATLMVLHVASQTVTANHGCTTDGVIFPVGPRTLTRGETVAVAMPERVRAKLCPGPARDCRREVLKVHTVFPTNCWNLNQGTVGVVIYVHKPRHKTRARVRLARPSARLTTACGIGNGGSAEVTLSNGAGASAKAMFVVNGKTYGPLAAGHSLTVAVALSPSGYTLIRVSAAGELLVSQRLAADTCPAPAPTASAALSCSAGGVVVTLANAPGATADATFEVNGTSYGPLAPGASQTVTVPVTPGTTAVLTVTSAAQTLLNASYTSSCSAAPSASAVAACSTVDPQGGGTIAVTLTNGAEATLPASFTVTATGNTSSGYGPQSIGPLAPGASETILIPIDGSGNTSTVTVSSGGKQLLDQQVPGCRALILAE
jgi:hypothetical protein